MDSLLSDPPNADVSIFEIGTFRQTVVVLEEPGTEGGDCTTPFVPSKAIRSRW